MLKKKLNNSYLDKIDFKTIFFFLFFLIITLVYSNYILNSGHGPGDEQAFLKRFFTKGFFKYAVDGVSGMAARAVSHILYALFFEFFNGGENIVTLIVSISWMTIVFFISLSLKRFVNKTTIFFFILICSFPFFVTTIFSSPIYVFSYAYSVLFWSISLYLILKYSEKKKNIFYFLSLFFLTLGVFTIENLPSLLILSIFLPTLNELKNSNFDIKKFIKVSYFYVKPVLFISLFFLVFKYYIATLITTEYYIYGTNIGPISIYQSLYYYFVILFEIPILLYSTIYNINNLKYIFLALIILILIIFIFKNDKKFIKFEKKNKNFNLYFVNIIFLSLASGSIIFAISGFPSSSFGYFNKLMIPTFVLYSILFSMFLNFLIKKKYKVVIYPLILLWILSFNIQLDNFVEAKKIREKVLNDLTNEFNKNNISTINLIANVPLFLKNNYNNENVFNYSTLIPNYFNYKHNIDIKNFWLLNDRRIKKNYQPKENLKNLINLFENNVIYYYYQYEEGEKNYKFEILTGKQEIIKKLKSLEENSINSSDIILNERIRGFFKGLYFNKF